MEKICALCCEHFTVTKTGTDWGHLLRSQKLSTLITEDGNCKETEGGNSGNLTVQACASCVTCVTSAVELKEKVVGVEEKLRQAQMLIFKMKLRVVQMLGELEGAVGGFKEAVEGVEGVLEESKAKVGRLDEVYGHSDQGNSLLKKAIQFREKIMKRLMELNEFRAQLERGLVGVSKPKQPQLCKPGRKRRVVLWSTFQKRLNRKQPRLEELAEPIVESERQVEQVNPESPVKLEAAEHDNHSHGAVAPVSPTGSGAHDKGDVKEEDVCVPPKQATLKKPQTKQKRKVSRMRFIQGVDLKGMPPFRRFVVTKILNLPRKIEMQRKTETVDTSTFDAIDPLKAHPLTYDPDLDKIVVGGIEIAVIEEEKRLQCDDCGFEINKFSFLRIVSHVFGAAHLDLLQCPCCPSKIATYDDFRQHVLGHAGKFTCDICGNPSLKRVETLRAHKWTHMSPEEKQEAVRNGATNPNASYLKLTQRKGSLHCSICGKGGFTALCFVKKHEETHKVPQHICTHCGKSYHSRGNFADHVKYGCKVGPVERHPFQCGVCLKRFYRESQFRNHKLTHGEATFKCDKCDRTFFTQNYLSNHKKRHERGGFQGPLPCSRCGALVKGKANLNRHETKCKGAGLPK